MELADKLNYFKIGLLSEIVSEEEFSEWLNKEFLSSDEQVLFELEGCKTFNERISCINKYLEDTGLDNPKNAMKSIVEIIKYKYKNKEWSLKQTLDYIYLVYTTINVEYKMEEPYYLMGMMDDAYLIWSEKEIKEKIKELFDYFN